MSHLDDPNGLERLIARLIEVTKDPLATISLALLLSLIALLVVALRL